MDASTLVWRDWLEQVKSLFPSIHGHQRKTLALFVFGLILAGSAVLQRIAENLEGNTSIANEEDYSQFQGCVGVEQIYTSPFTASSTGISTELRSA